MRVLHPSVAAIGIFDGVHRGHQAILKKAVARARAIRGVPAAITFHPHPVAVLHPPQILPLLLSLEQRLERFTALGIRLKVVVPFTRSFSRWSPERFVKELLVKRLKVREVVVGHDFRFGAGRKGDVETLRRLGQRHGFRVHAVAPVRQGWRRISSGALRRLIASGRLAQAEKLLGWPVAIVGKVVRGAQRGRSLGFPTANLKVEAGVLPPPGVYVVRARLGGRIFKGMANLGFRPTFINIKAPSAPPVLEVHLFGLPKRSGPLYGRRLEVAFGRKIRPERKFSSPQALARQLAQDAARAKALLGPFSEGPFSFTGAVGR